MGKDVKIFIGLIVISIVAGFFLVLRQGSANTELDTTSLGDLSEVEVTPNFVDYGEVPINGGIVEREYKILNHSEGSVIINKIVTSCMCTQANVTVSDKSSRYFGMEHPGDRNAPINVELPAGGEALVKVKFDPAAHGPAGVGAFDRVVRIVFSDPEGLSEIRFSGVVTK